MRATFCKDCGNAYNLDTIKYCSVCASNNFKEGGHNKPRKKLSSGDYLRELRELKKV